MSPEFSCYFPGIFRASSQKNRGKLTLAWTWFIFALLLMWISASRCAGVFLPRTKFSSSILQFSAKFHRDFTVYRCRSLTGREWWSVPWSSRKRREVLVLFWYYRYVARYTVDVLHLQLTVLSELWKLRLPCTIVSRVEAVRIIMGCHGDDNSHVITTSYRSAIMVELIGIL